MTILAILANEQQIRSEFDELLLNHARSCGVRVFEQTRVQSLSFSTDDPDKPVSVTWSHSATASPTIGTTTFDYVVDASGRNGLISTSHLKNRHFNSSLKNVAMWGYWRNTNMYGVGTSRENAPWFEALTGVYRPQKYFDSNLAIFMSRR